MTLRIDPISLTVLILLAYMAAQTAYDHYQKPEPKPQEETWILPSHP